MDFFFWGGRKDESQPEGPIIRAEAQRVKAAGDGVQGKGRPLPWVGKFSIFDLARRVFRPLFHEFVVFQRCFE